MKVITRFAPSPTGYLHIGSARTAIFNYLFARHHNGKFLLRIEDTDRERSTEAATNAIIDGMKWLGLNWDDQEIYQHQREKRHAEVAHQLVKSGKAYYCYLSKDELANLREESRITGKPITSPWRDESTPPRADVEPVIRIKSPNDGETSFNDLVLGNISVKNEIIDDFVILRADGSPTYMLAVVVDDYDMEITHVIRGDDHLNNTPKQIIIYDALNWNKPSFAHIPLIHGEDGAKLSKRHGALGVSAYKELGYLPETMNNYLLRLGWSHGNDEIISQEDAIKWFNIESIGKSPSRMDFKKLDSINSHYLKNLDNDRMLSFVKENITNLDDDSIAAIIAASTLIKERSKSTHDLSVVAKIFIIGHDFDIEPKLLEIIKKNKDIYLQFTQKLHNNFEWSRESLMNLAKEFAEQSNLKMNQLIEPFRIALTGSNASPSVFDIMAIIGKDESLRRINKYAF